MTTILVIEDADDLREDVIEMLGLEGYSAYGAENGEVGVTVAQREHPDLIVCDIMMPIMDGFGVLQKLRDDPATAMIPFIFLTAKNERIDQRQGMTLGADDYLTKPFMVEELLESISTQLKKREDMNDAVNLRMEQLRESIITALPHELRTPLNTIIGFSEMLQSEAQNLKPDQIVSWSGHIHKAAYRLYRLVENYLYYMRLQMTEQSDEVITVTEPVPDIGMIVESQAYSTAHKAQREADLKLAVDSSPPLNIGYKDMIKILDELLDNAFKFSVTGDAVRVEGQVKDDKYHLKISDEGRGISSEQVTGIGLFMQFDRKYHEQQGTGLGLVVVQLLAKVYNIDFVIEGKLDHGTSVCLKIPLHDKT